jgi:glycosyltransferase involved in cell wall biosynthesis
VGRVNVSGLVRKPKVIMKKKIVFLVNVDWFFISHRLDIAEEAVLQGWEVFVAAENSGKSHEIVAKGITFIDIKISRSGINIFEELSTLLQFYKIYQKVKPDVVHHITLKPVIYGTFIAKILKIKGVVNAISGLGYAFTNNRKGFVQRIMLIIMKIGFNRFNLSIIFQNNEDQEELQNLGVINSKNKIYRIKGSGVDLKRFYPDKLPEFDLIKILFPVRMLWDKGVKELNEATEILKIKYFGKIQFILSGLADRGNKAGVSEEYLREWEDGEYVKWIGYQSDMKPVYANSHIVVLPSYREGMPKSLLEACASGRAIVTTNAIGCKETVDEGVNGFKVPVASSTDLANALEELINNHDLIKQMGHNSRAKAEKEFDVKNVVEKHIEIYNSLLIG